MMREPLRSRMANPDPARITRAVFGLLARHVSGGEIQQIVSGLPEELRGLWPSEVAAGA